MRSPAIAKSPEWVEDISVFFKDVLDGQDDFFSRFEQSGNELTKEQRRQARLAFGKLGKLPGHTFDVVHLDEDVEKKEVAEVFVRINSEGVRLRSSDYILTWLSVFWPEGREQIEAFARDSRWSPEAASAITGEQVKWTPHNEYIDVEPGHVVRALVAAGQGRGRLSDAYSALEAKERTTGQVNASKQEEELDKLKAALPVVTDKTSWSEYVRSIRKAGFRQKSNVTSQMNIIYSYVLFLLGRNRYDVPMDELRDLIARWLFMSQLTSRYSGSSETQIQRDMDRVARVKPGDSAGFVSELNSMIDAQLTQDFWDVTLPQNLISSSHALSPYYQCYLAALNTLDAKMFMLDEKVADWMDPTQPATKGMEGHHLFPRSYQENILGITDLKRINQVANFAPTDWNTNIAIGDDAPATYWPDLAADRSTSPGWLKDQMYWHALPEEWHKMEYEEFLDHRRRLMSHVTRDAYRVMTGARTPEDFKNHG